MCRVNNLIPAACLSALLMATTLVSAVPLGEYAQASGNPDKQMAIFRSDFEASVSDALAALRNTHFKDGKEKSPQRIQNDQERADRIEQIASSLTANQAKVLITMISEYGAAQPNTDLKDVITGFLLTEAKNPLDREFQKYNESQGRYDATYRIFMENMETWERSEDKAQVELDREKADLACRRRKADDQVLDDGTKLHRDKDGVWHVQAMEPTYPECAKR